MLLILQFLAMVGIGIWLFSRFDWNRALKITSGSGKINVQTVEGPWLEPLVQALLFAFYFLGPGILLLLAGLGFVLLRRRGWMLASVAQALIMLSCLFFYGDSRPWFAYPLIAYSILMILLLNSRSVRAVVQPRRVVPVDPDRRLHMANEGSVDARTAEELLRRFEPVIRFTKGEWFYPMDSSPTSTPAVSGSRAPTRTVCVVPAGELTLERPSSRRTPPAPYTTSRSPTPRKGERGPPGAPLAHEPRLAQGDFPGRQGPPRARRLHLAVGGCALLPDVASQGRVPGGDVEARPVRPLHGGETTLHVSR